KIPALQDGSEGFRRLLEPRPEVLFVLDLACPDPTGHLVKKVDLVFFNEIAHMQTVHLDLLALESGGPLGHPGVVRIAWGRVAILRDEPTEADTRLPVEQ